jgi:hypothetical protein
MALGSVQINALNLAQGEPTEVENYFLYLGVGDGVASDQIIFLNTESNLDVELGTTDSELKRNIAAARLNAGQNWNCVAYELDSDSWQQALDKVLAAHIVVEAVVICTPVTTQAELLAMYTKAVSVWASYAIRLFFIATTAKIDPLEQTWAQYITALSSLTTGAVAERVTVAPQIYNDSVGVYAGRLSNKAQRVSDSPMRVASGALVGKAESGFPADELGVKFNNAHAKALNDLRFSVPQTYLGYPGVYFSDGATLDAPTGDYAVIENLRVVDSIARKLYPILISMIADRSINSTPVSMAWATNKLMQPLFTASKSIVFNNKPFPNDIKPPKDGDITLMWATRTKLIAYFKVTPYECPKAIEANIILDLSKPV